MAMLKFLKGAYGNLGNAAISEGQILITNDTHELFVDVSATERVKIGDFTIVATQSALEALDATKVPTTRLYYVEDGNILARSNGTTWIQVNKQKSADELKALLGLGSMAYVSEVAEANLATALKNKINGAATQASVDQLSDYVGTIPNGEDGNPIAASVVAYVDKKTEGIATDAALGELQNKVTALEEANAEGGSVATAIAEAKAQADKGVEDAAAALAKANEKTTMAEVEAKDYATKTEAQGYANAKDSAIQSAQTKADQAYELADTKTTMADVEAKDYATKTEAQGYANAKDEAIAAAKKAGDDAQADVDALEKVVGTPAEGKTIVQMIADAQTAATYDDEEVRGLISDNADAIAAEKERAEGIEAGLQNQINLIMNNPDTKDVIDSIAEFTQYVADHGTIAEGFRADIDKNKEDIADAVQAIADQATADAAKYETKEDAGKKLTEAKEYADGLDEAMGVRVKALEDINHNAYVAADEAVLSAAKEHANGLNTAMDTRVKALEEIDHDAYKAYADQAEADALSAAKEHANGLNTAMNTRMEAAEAAITRIDGEIDGHDTKIADLEAASATHALKTDVQAAQKALSDYQTANDAAVALKANSADVYAKTETYNKGQIDAAIADANTWGSF